MSVHTMLAQMAAYNLWANRRLARLCLTLPTDTWKEPVPSSFPSLLDTCLHIFDAELVWGLRLQGHMPSAFPSNTRTDDAPVAVIADWLEQSHALLRYVQQQTDETLLVPMDYTDMRGNRWTNSPAQMLQHCFNHSTFHRGQLVTMLRQLNVEPLPATDFITYLRQL